MVKLSDLQVAVDGLLADLAALKAENEALKQQATDTGDDNGLAALVLKVTEARKLPAGIVKEPPTDTPVDTPADVVADPIIPASP